MLRLWGHVQPEGQSEETHADPRTLQEVQVSLQVSEACERWEASGHVNVFDDVCALCGRTHVGCTKEFNRPDKLKAHILSHSGEDDDEDLHFSTSVVPLILGFKFN